MRLGLWGFVWETWVESSNICFRGHRHSPRERSGDSLLWLRRGVDFEVIYTPLSIVVFSLFCTRAAQESEEGLFLATAIAATVSKIKSPNSESYHCHISYLRIEPNG